jgi:hypothetical protein
MITNDNVAPYADERRCKAKMLLRTSEDAAPIIYENDAILTFSLIQEYQAEQASQPRGETTVNIIDTNNNFDSTNPNSLYHKLNSRSLLEVYVSSVENMSQDEFVQVAKMYFENAAQKENVAQVMAVDASGIIWKSSLTMIHVFESLKYPDEIYTSELLTQMFVVLGINNKCVISEELDKTCVLKRTWFYDNAGPYSIPKSIEIITTTLTNLTKSTVRAVITSNGDLRVFSVKAEPAETITKHNFTSFSIEASETTGKKNRLVVNDRGNILREPGDRIIVQADKEYDIEVFMLEYDFENGALKGQMKGLIQ